MALVRNGERTRFLSHESLLDASKVHTLPFADNELGALAAFVHTVALVSGLEDCVLGAL